MRTQRAFRWMMFVDGENFTLTAQKISDAQGFTLHDGDYFKRDMFCWIPEWPAGRPYGDISPQMREPRALRAYYYTTAWGPDPQVEEVRARLWNLGFDPCVFRKEKGSRSKGVDIALTKDMLAHGFRKNYEIAVLVAGDRDYLPLIEEVKQAGHIVYLMFFEQALHQTLKLAADRVIPLERSFEEQWRRRYDQKIEDAWMIGH